jgi:hypothetical protein
MSQPAEKPDRQVVHRSVESTDRMLADQRVAQVGGKDPRLARFLELRREGLTYAAALALVAKEMP